MSIGRFGHKSIRDKDISNTRTRLDLESKAYRFFHVEWRPPHDGLYFASRSSLLINAQMSSLYSTIGTRVHLRLALLSLCKKKPSPGRSLVELSYDPAAMFFAPLEEHTMERERIFAKSRAARPYEVRPNGRRYIQRLCYDFACENDTAAQYADITYMPTQDRSENSIQDILIAMFKKRFPKTNFTCGILGIEVPVFNPCAMFSKPKASRRCFFQQTQADFIAHVCEAESDRGHIVMGDYKVLMETSNPTSRVLNWEHVSQVGGCPP